jgi:DNA-binding response OmpR family regulator
VADTILLIEDDADTVRALSKALGDEYRVHSVETGSAAKAALEDLRPDLVILDLMLPDTDGLILTASLKTLGDVPVIICSARQQQVDRVLGLKLGADDFVPKPFDLEDLEARIKAVLRRARRQQQPAGSSKDDIRVGRLTICQRRATVIFNGDAMHLTPTEYRLLVALVSRPGEVLSRETLGQLMWGYHDLGTGHLIDVHIGRLRLKLRRASESDPAIVTVRGKGYTIDAEPAELPDLPGQGKANGGESECRSLDDSAVACRPHAALA